MTSARRRFRNLGGHAVVVGGSIGGLLAASALSDCFEHVTVLEKRTLSCGSGSDQALSQGAHVHSFLAEGQRLLEQLLPGMTPELERMGSRLLNFGNDFRFVHFGVVRPQYHSSIDVQFQTRPFLEDAIRAQVLALSNVTLLSGTRAHGFHCDSTMPGSVSGVRVADATSGKDQVISGDLVVDAGGRASRTPSWLKELGYQQPQERSVKLNLCYASRLYEEPQAHSRTWKGLIVYPRPGQTRAGYIFPVQHGRWLVSLAGYGGDRPATDDHGFMDFARSLATADVYDAILHANPVSEIRSIRFDSQRWLRYEKLRSPPDRLIVMGDAYCSLDPIFGQGMALCAIQATALKNCLAACRGSLNGFAPQFQRRLGKLLRTPWLLTTSEAFRNSSTVGDRLFLSPFIRWYSSHVFELSANRVDVYDAFLKVMHMVSPMSALFAPGIATSVLLKSLRECVISRHNV